MTRRDFWSLFTGLMTLWMAINIPIDLADGNRLYATLDTIAAVVFGIIFLLVIRDRETQ